MKIDFTGLTILFIVLKVLHVIDWSWFWVLSPTLLTLAVLSIVLIIAGFAYIAEQNK